MAAPCHMSINESHFHKTVALHEWWLIWSVNENHEKKLAIAGYTSLGRRPLRVFSSAPILRRHDVFTLETTDGIYVRIIGHINKTRTAENGFPSEVFKCFFLGFPPHWEVCAEHYLVQGFASNDVSREDASLKGSSQPNEENNNTNVGANVSPVSADSKLDEDHAVCQIREDSQKYNKAVMYITEAGGAKDPDGKKNADIEMENNLKEKAVIKEASKPEKKTDNNVSSEDASLKGCSNANEQINEMSNTEAIVSLANTDPELDQDHTACMIPEGSKNSNEAVRYITRARGAKDTDQRKTKDIEMESSLKEKAVIKEASTAEEKTYNNVSIEDASLKGCSNANEQINEMTNARTTVSLANKDSELDQDHTACMIPEGSKNSNEAVRYITRARGAKDKDQRKTAAVEKESILEEKAVIKEASTDEEKTYNNVSSEDASLKGCSNANEQINEMTNVSLANKDSELDQDHAACMIPEGSKNSNEAVRYNTRARGAKDKYHRKTAAVEKESILEEKTTSKEASTAGKKTCTDVSRRLKESSKKSNKAVKYLTRFGGARNTDHKRTATVEKESTSLEEEASKETSTPEKKTKRKLTYGSPVTPKVNEIASVISPELSSVKRSRSGRLLLPTLEYWRNQTAVYDPDHQVIGIKDGISAPSRAEVTHEPKRAVGRPRKIKDSTAAVENHEPKRAVGRPRKIKDSTAAMENMEIKSSAKRFIIIGMGHVDVVGTSRGGDTFGAENVSQRCHMML